MLQVNRVTKKYRKNEVLHNISFNVSPGEIAILLGPNGAGKSTTIKCITGLLKFDGEITVGGNSNKSLNAKRILGYAPEAPVLYELLTVQEHIEFIAKAYVLTDYEERASQLFEMFDLADKTDKFGKDLSKGMMQKVSLCCAMIIQPKLLLLDEPMVGLDPKAIRELKKYLAELKNNGTAILISTHMIDSVEELWDKVVVMKDGDIVLSQTRKQLQDHDERLEQLFFEVMEG